jgi:hypothetical protein
MQLKPQDFLVALKLVAWGEQRWTYARLAQELGLSASEAHGAVKRGCRLGCCCPTGRRWRLPHRSPPRRGSACKSPQAFTGYAQKGAPRCTGADDGDAAADNPVRPHPHNLAEFALHGAKYAFPVFKLPLAVGVPTSHSAPAFAGIFAPGSTDFVWPHPNGPVRGVGVEPLHPSVPFAAMQDAKLYELLALFDALRVGKARERGMALERLQALIDPDAPTPLKEAAAWLTPTGPVAGHGAGHGAAVRSGGVCGWLRHRPAGGRRGLMDVRPTEDVDAIVEVASLGAYHRLAEQLMQRGFKQTMEDNTPPFRWFWNRMQLDLVPLDEKVLGFANPWYRVGFEERTFVGGAE